MSLSNFNKLFGVLNDKLVSYLFILLNYFISVCKLKDVLPNFAAIKFYVNKQKEIEYYMAKKRNKLPIHFRKWKFDI